MSRRREDELEDGGTYWAGVADSLLAALMIVLLLAFGALALFTLNPHRSELEIQRLQRLNDALTIERDALRAESLRQQADIARLQRERPRPEPPIIELTDAQNMNFESGKAQISPEFASRLEAQEFPRLLQIIDAYPVVDTIEVIGHTDDVPISSSRGNLDGNLSSVLAGTLGVSALIAGSNADLGLMRAVAVKEGWSRWLAGNRQALPRPIAVRCYSAANAVPPFGAADLPRKIRDQKARRIEIRFTQLRKGREDSPGEGQ